MSRFKSLFMALVCLSFTVASAPASDALPSLAMSEQPELSASPASYAVAPSDLSKYAAVPSKSPSFSAVAAASSPVSSIKATGCQCQACQCDGACPSSCSDSAVTAVRRFTGGDVHSRQCPSPTCGYIWTHRTSDAREGDHNCPKCGTYQNIQLEGFARGNVEYIAAPVVVPKGSPANPFADDCPNGQCYRNQRGATMSYSQPSAAYSVVVASGSRFRPVRNLLEWIKNRPALGGRIRSGGCCGG